MADNVLTLSTTEFDRPPVEIDGERYEMRSPDELSTKLLTEMIAVGKALSAIDKIEDAEESVAALQAQMNRGLAVCMVDLPDEVRDRLSLMQQRRIVEVFSDLLSDAKDKSPAPSPES